MPEVRVVRVEDLEQARNLMAELEIHHGGIDIMAPKSQFRVVKITDLDVRAANILKQEILSRGGEAALPWHVFSLDGGRTSALVMGTLRQFKELVPKLSKQPFQLKNLATALKSALEAYDAPPKSLSVGGRVLDFEARTHVMGILNVTPDSFSDGGEALALENAVRRGIEMLEAGADIIDIGGESTRPGALPVSESDEMERVLPVVEALSKQGAIVSIDTSKPEVARAAISKGAHIINDITGLSDPSMIQVAAETGAPAILMHMKGTPRTMQIEPAYDDLMGEITGFFRERIKAAEEAGVDPNTLLIDPGIGFGKNLEHNLEILRRLSELKTLGKAIVLGTSRKSFIGRVLGQEVPAERTWGTAATVAVGIVNGAHIVRVHDVKEMTQVVKMTDGILGR